MSKTTSDGARRGWGIENLENLFGGGDLHGRDNENIEYIAARLKCAKTRWASQWVFADKLRWTFFYCELSIKLLFIDVYDLAFVGV